MSSAGTPNQPLTQKLLNLQFSIGPVAEQQQGGPPVGTPQTFPGTNADTVLLTGLRCSAEITLAGGITLGALQLTVYGMTPDQMNTLSTLGMKVIIVPKSLVTIFAGDTNNTPSQVYQGSINQAYTDYSSAPDVAFRVESTVGIYDKVASGTPTSTNGTTAVATIMVSLAQKAGIAAGVSGGYPLQNYGVTAQASPMYLWGSYWEQMGQLAKAYRFNLFKDVKQSPPAIQIWPVGGSKTQTQVPLISPATGMVGYPSFTYQGIMVRTLYNPAISYGTQVQVQSSIPQANGTWYVYKIGHVLESMVPNGNWFTDLGCYKLGTVPVLQ